MGEVCFASGGEPDGCDEDFTGVVELSRGGGVEGGRHCCGLLSEGGSPQFKKSRVIGRVEKEESGGDRALKEGRDCG